MKKLLLVIAALTTTCVFAQPVKPPAPATPKACDVTYTTETETADGQDVTNAQSIVYGLPYADVLDNTRKGMRVIDLVSKLQDKGGPYTIELFEVRVCDGGPAVKIDTNSIEARGITLRGANQIARLTLQIMSEVTGRYEGRDARGEKRGWDHNKARKVKRNDVHQKQW